MIAKLVVEGHEFDIEILDPKLQKLIAPKKKTGYERVNEGERYCIINNKSTLTFLPERGDEEDKIFYDLANYYESEFVAVQNTRADTLMRQLRRFAVEHRVNTIDWEDEEQSKYYIWFDCDNLRVGSDVLFPEFGSIIFDSEKSCKQAIETFRDELIWYFTEYKDSL